MATALRLVVIPLPAFALLLFLPLSMLLGLNAIVVPAAYGRDTSIATRVALISHLFYCPRSRYFVAGSFYRKF